ncbi:DUF58 domain-containing protein [Salinadaptatus halalkaliphilus]|uniref:DUF58 domain-containing protein n=1 Tax=Salinadaptatus halalkaliphilus TaxID=2419781 RepID=A0A4S3TK94_9EURY|nr:DUF58 domain-containing protein [Salinadaptatus halalkaliphilus]THE63345.1 DUF58 domain-containing protein [Salinadaptatus halalkaliphilus]
MNRWRLALGLGIVALVGAVGIAVWDWSLGLNPETITLAGACLLLIALSAMSARRGSRSLGRPPAPERRTTVPVPGDSLSDALDSFRTSRIGLTASSRRIEHGLRTAAIAALTRFEGVSTTAAEGAIEDGTWTDDQVAAAYLSESVEPPPRDLRDRLLSIVGREQGFRTAVCHTAGAIAAIPSSRAIDSDSNVSVPEYGQFSTSRAAEPDRSNRSSPQRTADRAVSGIELRARRSTGHWTGIGVVALCAVGIGAIAQSPPVALAGVVGIGYAGFARSLEPPTLELSLERELSDADPDPGDEIDVALTITNDGDGFVPDLRLVDGVPPGLAVTEGSSRLGTALRPGESVTLEYTVAVGRGRHEFDPVFAVVRDLSRSSEHEYVIESDTTVVCEPALEPLGVRLALRSAATARAGRRSTDVAGAGTTFHSVREYRPADPLARIDWNRRAKTGELATLEFHEERSARVLVLVDARTEAYLAPEPDATHAVDRSVDAAGRIAATLLETGDTVGLAALGPTTRDGTRGRDTDLCWLAPTTGRDHAVRIQERLGSHPQFDPAPPDTAGSWRPQLKTIRRRLDDRIQIVFLSPLCDPASVTVARRLEARDHPVTVVSPDPTTDRTAGQQLAGVARRVRCVDLRRADVPVVDWQRDESLEEVLARFQERGRR